MEAFCWANGVIGFGRSVPEGALPIASGDATLLKAVIAATATLSFDKRQWLVPGIFGSGGGDAAVDALLAYVKEVKKRRLVGYEKQGLHPRHFVHTWIKVADFLPDADLVVLVCVSGASEPVWMGYLDGEDWRYVDAMLIEVNGAKVIGWSDLPEPLEGH